MLFGKILAGLNTFNKKEMITILIVTATHYVSLSSPCRYLNVGNLKEIPPF